jgi:hypothetical protein
MMFPAVAFSWTSTTGSTVTPVGQYDPTDIINMVFDYGSQSITVTIASGTITTIISGSVLSSDTVTHTWLSNMYDRMKNIAITSGTITSLQDIANIVASSDTKAHGYLVEIRDRQKSLVISSGSLSVSGVVGSSDTFAHDLLTQIRNNLKTIVITSGTIYNVQSGTITVLNFPSDYPDAVSQASLSSIDANTLNTVNQMKSSVTVADVRYSNKISTGTSGKTFSSGNISITNYELTGYAYYTEGGNAQVTSTFEDGIKYMREGIPYEDDIEIPVSNVTIQVTLDSDTTFYYTFKGVQ